MCTFNVAVIIMCFLVYWIVADGDDNSGKRPLILTPYINQGQISTAKQLAKVKPDIGNTISYSGFFTVDESCGNNLFFWFTPANTNWMEAPTIIWHQGGPGSSSLYGMFELIGPFNSLPGGLESRKYSWTNFSNMLFIDNPVGAGFSLTTGGCYATTIESVTKQLYNATLQFFKLFPNLKSNKVYLAGESFAGHYIPSLGVLIDDDNKYNKMNLAGILMGNPIVNLDCHDYGSYLYQIGIADEKLRDDIYVRQDMLKRHVKEGNYSAAYDDWYYILNDLINDRTHIPNRYNFVDEPDDFSNYPDYVTKAEVRKQIHVGNAIFTDRNIVTYNNLLNTIAEPSSGYIEKLLKDKKYLVVFYSGQLDIICMYTSAVCVMRGLQWGGRQAYLDGKRLIWSIDGQVVGWIKSAENILWDILVRDAGHAVPYYMPEAMYVLMSSIVSAAPGINPIWKLDLETATVSSQPS